MKQTIYYLSDIKWKRETLFAHIKYAERSKDFRGFFGDKEEVIKAASMAMSKRKNALAGFSCVLAVPNDLDMDGIANVANKVKSIFSNLLDTDYILIYYHDSTSIVNNKNKHFHIIVANLNRQGKSLRVNKNMLKQLHSELQACLNDMGYEIRKEEPGIQIKHLGYRLLKDPNVKQDYIQYLHEKKSMKHEIQQEVIQYERELEQLENEIRATKTTAVRTRAKLSESSTRIRDEYTKARTRIPADQGSHRTQDPREASGIPSLGRDISSLIIKLSKTNRNAPKFRQPSSKPISAVFPSPRTITSTIRESHRISRSYYVDPTSKALKYILQMVRLNQKMTLNQMRIQLATIEKLLYAIEKEEEKSKERTKAMSVALADLYDTMKKKGYTATEFVRKCISFSPNIPLSEITRAITTVDGIDTKTAHQIVAEQVQKMQPLKELPKEEPTDDTESQQQDGMDISP